MTWGGWTFVAGCSIITFAMIGSVSLAAGAIVAGFVGLLLWSMLLALPDEGRDRR